VNQTEAFWSYLESPVEFWDHGGFRSMHSLASAGARGDACD
jgi:hypothetical protein